MRLKKATKIGLVLCAIQDYPYETNGVLLEELPIPFTHSIRKKSNHLEVKYSKEDKDFMSKLGMTKRVCFHSHPKLTKEGSFRTGITKSDKEDMQDAEIIVSLNPFNDNGKKGKGCKGHIYGHTYILRAYNKSGEIKIE